MVSMNTLHAPNRCDTRAIRIAKVKFVVLELDQEFVVPVETGTQPSVLETLRNFLIRVIGRLEAARP